MEEGGGGQRSDPQNMTRGEDRRNERNEGLMGMVREKTRGGDCKALANEPY